MDKTKAIILGGGQGKRLYTLTARRPKPCVPLEKRRLIDFAISNCLNSTHINAVDILIQTHANALLRYIEDAYLPHVIKPVRCHVPPMPPGKEAERFAGTADAIRQSGHVFYGSFDHILVLAGDHLYVMDYDPLIHFHARVSSDITVVVQRFPAAKAAGQLGVFWQEGDKIHFIEKPEQPSVIPGTDQCLANLGIYVFNPQVLGRLLDECDGNDFGRQVIPHAIDRGYKVDLFEHEGYWRDVGTVQSLWEANMDLTGPSPAINFYNRAWPIYHRPRYLPSPKFINGCRIQDAIVSDGSIVAGEIISSVLSTRIRVGSESRICQSVIFDGVTIGSGVELNKVIVDKRVRIGDGVKLGFDLANEARRYPQLDIRDEFGGIIVIPKDVVIE